eukprot:6722528-Alexandrium_andersonii.AAC.1
MSASLVGSEMCIRDRPSATPRRVCSGQSPGWRAGLGLLRAVDRSALNWPGPSVAVPGGSAPDSRPNAGLVFGPPQQ